MTIAERVHTLNARGLDIPFIGAILNLTLTQVEEVLLGGEVEEEEGSGGNVVHRSYHAAPQEPVENGEEAAPLPTPDRVSLTLTARTAVVLYASVRATLGAGVPALLAVSLDGAPLVAGNVTLGASLSSGFRTYLLGENFTTYSEGEDPQPGRGYGMMLELDAGEHTIELVAVGAEAGTPVTLEERLLMVEVLS